jgi:hypothetical protein
MKYPKYASEVAAQGWQVSFWKPYLDGTSLRRITRHSVLNHQSAASGAKAHADQLRAAPIPGKN